MASDTRMVRWTHNGFHGYARLACRVPADSVAGDVVRVSAGVARRLNAAVCSCKGCACGEQVACQDQDMEAGRVVDFWAIMVPKGRAVVRGSHPRE